MNQSIISLYSHETYRFLKEKDKTKCVKKKPYFSNTLKTYIDRQWFFTIPLVPIGFSRTNEYVIVAQINVSMTHKPKL